MIALGGGIQQALFDGPNGLLLVLLLGPWLVSCAAQVAGQRPAPQFGGVAGPLVIAHRGGSLEAPENTLASVRHGVASGADWQEIDVRLTADGEVVVIHDAKVDRTTGGHGTVEQLSFAELRKLSAGRPTWSEEGRARLAMFEVVPPDFGERFLAERVPTLAEVLAIPGTRLMIELKRTARGKELVEGVVEAVHAAGAADRVALGSFEPGLLELVQAKDPSLPLIGIVEDEDMIDRLLELPISVLAVRLDLAATAREKAPAGVAVWAWTAYSVAMAEAAVEQGANGVITDVPAAVLAAFRPPAIGR